MKKFDRSLNSLILAAALSFMALAANAQIPPPEDPSAMLSDAYTGKVYSPYAGRNFPTFPLWGDSHLHTGNSFDAGAFGATLQPEDAYQFARGDEVVASSGTPIKLSRPLDWLVVADHSDNVGFFRTLKPANRPFWRTQSAGTGTTASRQATVCQLRTR